MTTDDATGLSATLGLDAVKLKTENLAVESPEVESPVVESPVVESLVVEQEKRPAYDLLIFDWDATLVDSAGDIVACMQQVINELGLPRLPDESIRNIIGLGLSEAILALYPGTIATQVQQIRECYSHHFSNGRYGQPRFFSGAREVLYELHAAGYKLAVATGKSRRGLDRVLTGLDCADLFHASRCADETRSKPHPQMLNELLQEFNLEPHQAVMIGDTEYDLGMAKAANMDRIAVSYGAHELERLLCYEPRFVAHNIEQLKQWLL